MKQIKPEIKKYIQEYIMGSIKNEYQTNPDIIQVFEDEYERYVGTFTIEIKFCKHSLDRMTEEELRDELERGFNDE